MAKVVSIADARAERARLEAEFVKNDYIPGAGLVNWLLLLGATAFALVFWVTLFYALGWI
jgi:hypothetical protein